MVSFIQKTGIGQFIKGGFIVLIMIFGYELLISWNNGTLGNEITMRKFIYKIQKSQMNPLNLFRGNPNFQKKSHKITHNDMETWFFNESNIILNQMINEIKLGNPVVTYVEEEKNNNAKIYSLILVGLHGETIHQFFMDWVSVNQILYFVNPCIYYPIDVNSKKTLKAIGVALTDENFNNMLQKEFHNTVAVISDMVGGYDGEVFTVVKDSTKYLWGKHFKPLKSILDKRKKPCFY